MENELTCAVCSDIYLEGKREPVTLPVCGHTFCRQCLLSIEKTENFICPYCRAKHPGPPVAEMSTVYAILNLTKYLRRSKFGICGIHSSTWDFWCQTCSTGLCGFCLFETQCKINHEVLVMKNAMDEKKTEIKKAGTKYLETIDIKKELAMKKIHSYFEGIFKQSSYAESLNISIKNIKELMADAENTLNMDLAVSVHKNIHNYLSSIGGNVEDVSEADLTSTDFESSSSSCTLSENDNTRKNGSFSGFVSNGDCQDILVKTTMTASSNDSKTDEGKCMLEDSRPTGAMVKNKRHSRYFNHRESAVVSGIFHRNFRRDMDDDIVQLTRGPDSPENPEFARVFNGLENQSTMSSPGTSFSLDSLDTQSSETPRLRQNDMTSSDDNMDEFTSAGWLSWSAKGDDGREGRFRWEDGRLHLYTLTDDTYTVNSTIKLSVILSLLPSSPEVFLDLGAEGVRFGRVYIRIWGYLRRAQHFLALCTGSLGPSYKGIKCSKVEGKDKPGECLRVSHYIKADGTLASRGLMGGLEWSGEYSTVKREGLVVSACGGRNDYDGCFDICTKGNPNKKFSCPFGEVISGLEVVKEATCYEPIGDLMIMDTGVVVLNSR